MRLSITRIIAVTLTIALLTVGCTSCRRSPRCDVVIENRTSTDIQNARVHFGKYECRAGLLGPGSGTGGAVYLDYPHPITPEAVLFWDAAGGEKRDTLDLRAILPLRKPGELIFTIYEDRTAVRFTPDEKSHH